MLSRDRDEGMEDGSRDNRQRRGRGEDSGGDERDERYSGTAGVFHRLDNDRDNDSADHGPARSIEGYIIIVSNVHEEANEEDIQQPFSEFGVVKNLHLNLDRRTGFAKFCQLHLITRTPIILKITRLRTIVDH
eukprot:GHVN01035014.1.p1 GENE.GHVN01035014.1~~GHVN01035014.1.p1  ORF type:complete len:133 (+),score=19.07 GHVN01035014.1:93-491(+)